MKITDVKIRRTFADSSLKAIVSITIDDCFAVHDIRIIQGNGRLFAAMPSRKDDDVYRDIVHPITATASLNNRKMQDCLLYACFLVLGRYVSLLEQAMKSEGIPYDEITV